MSQSFRRGLMILDLFSLDRPVMTLEEVAKEINTSTITAYRYVKVLCDAGMLVMSAGQIKLSAQILRFVNLFLVHEQLISAAKDEIKKLHQEYNETIALCKLEENDIVCIHKLESSLSLRASYSIGQRMSIHAGAFARTIAAFLPAKKRKAIIDTIDWKPFTEHTIISRDEFDKRLERIVEKGYDISREEVIPGVIAFAVPIFVKGEVVASLGFGMPSVRNDSENTMAIVSRLKETANTISQKLEDDPLFMP